MKTFPHLDTNIRDDSIYRFIIEQDLPVHRPFYAIKAEKGPVNQIIWYPDYDSAVSVLGDKTFDHRDLEYFSRDSMFLLKSLEFNGAFIMRLGEDNMRTSSIAVWCKAGVIPAVTAYKYDVEGGSLPATVEIVEATGTWAGTIPGGSETLTFTFAADVWTATMTVSGGTDVTWTVASTDSVTPPLVGWSIGSDSSAPIMLTLQADTALPVMAPAGAAYETTGTVEAVTIDTIEKVDATNYISVNTFLTFTFAADVWTASLDDGGGNTGTWTVAGVEGSLPLTGWTPATTEGPLTLAVPDDAKVMYKLKQVPAGTYLSELEVDNDGYYPLAAFTAADPGKYGKDLRISLRPALDSKGKLESTRMEANEAMLYNIGFLLNDPETNIPSKFKTKYSVFDFAFIPQEIAVDAQLGLDMDFASAQGRYFDSEAPAPVETEMYYANIATIQKTLMARAKADAGDAWNSLTSIDTDGISTMVDVFNAASYDGKAIAPATYNYEDNSVVEDALADSPFDSDAIYMVELRGGSDGLLSGLMSQDGDNNMIDLLRTKAFDATQNQTIVDAPRFPFNHIIDTGFNTAAKESAISLLTHRKDVKYIGTVWKGGTTIADISTMISLGTTLRDTIRLTTESEVFGTGVFRGSIFGQTGILNDERYRKPMPLTIWYAIKKAEFGNTQTIGEQVAGLPNAVVDIFKEIDHLPAGDEELQGLWDANINYCQHSDMKGLHFASLHSVYKYDTSVLSSDAYSDAAIYTVQASHPIWAKYAGVETVDLTGLHNLVKKDLDRVYAELLGNRYTAETRVYQTEEEAQIGFIHHIEVKLRGGPQFRVAKLDIIAEREGFNA